MVTGWRWLSAHVIRAGCHRTATRTSSSAPSRSRGALRWPWTTDLSEWREDIHLACGPPSALVIPPGVVHTTQMTGRGRNVLVDIFCPPRTDFVQKPGCVLNERDYSVAYGGAPAS
jgi:hypothetical protein